MVWGRTLFLWPVTRPCPWSQDDQAGVCTMARLGAGHLESHLWNVNTPPTCSHPNPLLQVMGLILTWAFLTSLTHLRIAQSLGSGLKQHYFWLLMTFPKPPGQCRYLPGCPGSSARIAAGHETRGVGGGDSCCVLGAAHAAGYRVLVFHPFLGLESVKSHHPCLSLPTWLFSMLLVRGLGRKYPCNSAGEKYIPANPNTVTHQATPLQIVQTSGWLNPGEGVESMST